MSADYGGTLLAALTSGNMENILYCLNAADAACDGGGAVITYGKERLFQGFVEQRINELTKGIKDREVALPGDEIASKLLSRLDELQKKVAAKALRHFTTRKKGAAKS